MKQTLLLAALLAGLAPAYAQEKVPREECLKYAFIVSANLKELLDTPIPTDPDVKRPAAVKDENCGAMVLPQTQLAAETFSKIGKEVVPVGQLWMANLVPMTNGEAVAAERLRLVHVSDGNNELDAACFALGARKASEGGLELVLYGKTTEPLLLLPLKAVSIAQAQPIDLAAERKGDGTGMLTLSFFGKYEARLKVRPVAP